MKKIPKQIRMWQPEANRNVGRYKELWIEGMDKKN